MLPIKSLDKLVKLIECMLLDIQTSMSHSSTFTKRAVRLTVKKTEVRVAREGIGFLTKTLPRLCKAFDKALLGEYKLNAAELGFSSYPGCKFPRFLGELFSNVLASDGSVLSDPCVTSIRHIRELLLIYYKLDIPFTTEQEAQVLNSFKQTELDLLPHDTKYSVASSCGDFYVDTGCGPASYSNASLRSSQVAPFPTLGFKPCGLEELPKEERLLVRKARKLLQELFSTFDPSAIVPRHGPGAVSTKEKLWDKWRFTTVSKRIQSVYPLDAYFYASLGHVCDRLDEFKLVSDQENSARVILVPKDSRGPRLISCEPLEYQWVQQGLGRAIMHHVEHHPLTRYNVHFSDQSPNQCGALLGSATGRYATLDLKEASDRVSLGLVRLLFPSGIVKYLENCRSLSTRLPTGEVLNLRKFAPMGSALCFPILALTTWALLAARAEDADTRDGILVYGDDVVVPTAFAADAIEQLETFGLLVNRAKSCVTGFFRESCGVDAYKGHNITPLRLRKGLPSRRQVGLYPSSIAFANALYDRGFFSAFEYVRELIHHEYGNVPSDDMELSVPSLREVEPENRPYKWRINHALQKKEWYVKAVESRPIRKTIDGWSMLLRCFTEGGLASAELDTPIEHEQIRRLLTSDWHDYAPDCPFGADSYTRRDSIRVTNRWR